MKETKRKNDIKTKIWQENTSDNKIYLNKNIFNNKATHFTNYSFYLVEIKLLVVF